MSEVAGVLWSPIRERVDVGWGSNRESGVPLGGVFWFEMDVDQRSLVQRIVCCCRIDTQRMSSSNSTASLLYPNDRKLLQSRRIFSRYYPL
jgi:hypothetical protein